MNFKYTLRHVVDNYVVEVVLSKLYSKGDTIMVGTEEFLIDDREDV